MLYTVRAVAPHRCKEAPLPTAFISHNLTAYLRNASRAGDTINATMTDPDDGGFDCMGRTLKPIWDRAKTELRLEKGEMEGIGER